jgi:predicted transcriptional regulator
MSKVLFLSVKPRFANAILDGSKTLELRRVCPQISKGSSVILYSSSPQMAIAGTCRIHGFEYGPRALFWECAKDRAGVTEAEYDRYFACFSSAEHRIGIALVDVQRLASPIPLSEMRRRWPWLRPPQSYRFVDASFVAELSQ